LHHEQQIGEHITWQLPLLGSVHADTIVTTWVVMLLSLALFWIVGRSYRSSTYQTRRQTIVEGVVNYIADLATSTLGEKGEPFVPFFVSLFVFIFLLNQFGMFPFKVLGLPFGGSPTGDLNTTVPLALMIFFLTWFVGIRQNGIKHFGHLAKPFWWLWLINVVEELARPATLAARLFFNIFVGELLLIIISSIIVAHVKVGSFDLSFAAAFIPFFVQFFNFFVGTVQAFVFTLLAIVYLSLATAEDH
jgi:F-type H+-transporting ATPase subunit a